MHKKISAVFILMLFGLGIIAMPVQAHFTLGKYTGTYDWHTTDFDGADGNTAHVPGLVGYVFPGAGPLTSSAPGMYSTIAGSSNQKGYPGYQSLYPSGKPAGIPNLWLQADANAYAPFGAILTSTIKSGTAFNKLFLNGNPTIWGPRDNSVNALAIEHAVEGDLIFGINYTLPLVGTVPTWPNGGAGYWFDRVEIWVPPEFQGIKKENIVASFTNAYGNIAALLVSDPDIEITPNGWTRVRINTDNQLGGSGWTAGETNPWPGALPVYQGGTTSTGLTTGNVLIFGNATYGDVWAYIRVNKVTAPTIAGKYFFKMSMRCAGPNTVTNTPAEYSSLGTAAPYLGTNLAYRKMVWLGSPEAVYHAWRTNGVPNFPVLLVKGEVDPAYVDGTIRYGGYSGASYYGMPIALPGRARLVGRAIDPYTLAPTNRPVEARGYFNSTANGHFEVEGVAPGIYDIYASAAGYPEKLIQTGVTILKGQSYHVDAYLTPGVVIQGDVFSKCGTGEVNWVTWRHNTSDFEYVPGSSTISYQDMRIEIYKIGSVPTATGTYGVTAVDVENVQYSNPTPAVSFSPLTGLTTNLLSGWGRIPIKFAWPGYGGDATVGADSNGVGPEQQWMVTSNTANFKFQFGDKGLYGAPTGWSGHVPQLNATWIDGLPAGQYEVRAFTTGYVQTKADGMTFEHIVFNVPQVEWPGDIYVPFDLRLSNYIKKTVHFHDIPGTLAEKPIPGHADNNNYRLLYVELRDSKGNIDAWKTLPVTAQATSTYGGPGGLTWAQQVAAGYNPSGDVYVRGLRAGVLNVWSKGGQGRNYGIVSDNYQVRAYMWGYVEQVFETVTVGLCGSEIAISDHMYRGVMFNVTFSSKDWEHPTADKPWKYPDEFIYLQVWKGGQQLNAYGYNGIDARAAGNEVQMSSGNFFRNNLDLPAQQPFGLRDNQFVRSSFRVKAGAHVTNKQFSATGTAQPTGLWKSWVNPTLTTTDKSFVHLYLEGMDANHESPVEQTYFYDADWKLYPLAFETGRYDLVGLTYGYVNQFDPLTKAVKPFQLYATKGGVANVQIKLIQGVQIPLIIRFKHERVFEHLRMNSTVRVRIFDDKDALVGEWLTSSSINGTSRVAIGPNAWTNVVGANPYGHVGEPAIWHLGTTGQYGQVVKGLPEEKLSNTATNYAFVHPEGLKQMLGPGYSFVIDPTEHSGESVNYVPRSTMMLNLTICGLPDPYATGAASAQWNPRFGYDRAFDVNTWVPGKFGAPGAPYGINGDPWYMGGYYVETEVVPVGREIDNKHYKIVSLPYGSPPGSSSTLMVYDGWYPFVDGLLYGETCTIDPRTGKLYPWAMPQLHLGPYQQRVHIALPGAHLGGESSGILELDHLGLAQGWAYSYTWCDDWRTTSWVMVQFSGAPGLLTYYTFDGHYEAYLPAGTWKMDVIPWLAGAKAPGYGSQSFTLAISDGQVGGYNVYLEETGVPVPEFPTAIVVLASALAAALSILRRRKK